MSRPRFAQGGAYMSTNTDSRSDTAPIKKTVEIDTAFKNAWQSHN
jgi:hypothetical protein